MTLVVPTSAHRTDKLMDFFIDKYRNTQFTEYGVLPEENIIFGESYDLSGLDSTAFPRLEILVWKGFGREERAYNLNEGVLILSVGAHIYWKDDSGATDADYRSMARLKDEVEWVAFTANDDRAQGILPIEGFEKVDDLPNWDLEEELAPCVMSTIFNFNILFTKPNT